MVFGGIKLMWIMVCFDLPTKTKKQRKIYSCFRMALLKDGFTMMQYSIYYRYCGSRENMNVHISRLRKYLPIEGDVNILNFTDKQFGQIERHNDGAPAPREEAPKQLMFF